MHAILRLIPLVAALLLALVPLTLAHPSAGGPENVTGGNASVPSVRGYPCNLTMAVLPQAPGGGGGRRSAGKDKGTGKDSPKELPAVPKGQKLLHVARGRGTQNYTCSNTTSNPQPNGALATLYDITCLVASRAHHAHPSLAHSVAAKSIPRPSGEVLGHHYFRDAKTPVFRLGGVDMAFEKDGECDAPGGGGNATVSGKKGGRRDVAWLFLRRREGSGGGSEKAVNGSSNEDGQVKTVFRVNTAGGEPLEGCRSDSGEGEGEEEGKSDSDDKEVRIGYAAEYWFYG